MKLFGIPTLDIFQFTNLDAFRLPEPRPLYKFSLLKLKPQQNDHRFGKPSVLGLKPSVPGWIEGA